MTPDPRPLQFRRVETQYIWKHPFAEPPEDLLASPSEDAPVTDVKTGACSIVLDQVAVEGHQLVIGRCTHGIVAFNWLDVDRDSSAPFWPGSDDLLLSLAKRWANHGSDNGR